MDENALTRNGGRHPLWEDVLLATGGLSAENASTRRRAHSLTVRWRSGGGVMAGKLTAGVRLAVALAVTRVIIPFG
jgi:hypothetical protein